MNKIYTDAIILDVDGTIWNSTQIVANGWNRAIQEMFPGREKLSAEYLSTLFGKTMTEIAAAIFPEQPEEKRAELGEIIFQYEEEELEKDPCHIDYPGVVDTIREISKTIPVYVVSNCQAGYIEQMMRKLDIEESITDTLCFGDTGFGKARNLQILIEKNKITNPVYVGDTSMDQNACEEAGVPFIHAAYGFGNVDQDKTVGIISEFSELLRLCEYEKK